MPITNDSELVADEYDIIIVGGGSAGCVLAGKLSKAALQAGLSILLIEAGRNNHNDPNVIRPGRYWSILGPDSGYFDFIKGQLSHCGGREIAFACPCILGGGGSVNFMMYTRASASDFDDWKTEGWYAKDVIPILRELENYQNPNDPNPDRDVHGFSGPFAVSQGNGNQAGEPHAKEIHLVAQKLGYPVVPDAQNLRTGHGFSEWPKWIDPVTGHRQDPAHRYIHPNVSKDGTRGLTVLCEHKVARVNIEEGRARAVEIVHTTKTKLDLPTHGLSSNVNLGVPDDQTPTHVAADSSPRVVRARSLIVISAGTVNTAQLLERSGIGSPEILGKAGVDCIVDLPGVGENFQDHLGVQYLYRFARNTLPSYTDYLSGDPAALLQADEDFKHGKGAHATNFIWNAAKIRPSEEELQETDPEFRKLWDDYYRNAPDKPLFINAFLERPTNNPDWPFLTKNPDYVYKAAIPYSMYPVSRGSIHITGPSVNTLPEFCPHYLGDPRDLQIHVLAYKHQRELVRRLPSFRGEVCELHPPFSETSAARCIEHPTPAQLVEMANAKVIYTEEDNKVIETHAKANFAAVWHWLGTAAMRPREQGGVVDKNLNVYGVQGLKVADLSICPENVGANTYNTALMIGGKAAEIVAGELGLKLAEK